MGLPREPKTPVIKEYTALIKGSLKGFRIFLKGIYKGFYKGIKEYI